MNHNASPVPASAAEIVQMPTIAHGLSLLLESLMSPFSGCHAVLEHERSATAGERFSARAGPFIAVRTGANDLDLELAVLADIYFARFHFASRRHRPHDLSISPRQPANQFRACLIPCRASCDSARFKSVSMGHPSSPSLPSGPSRSAFATAGRVRSGSPSRATSPPAASSRLSPDFSRSSARSRSLSRRSKRRAHRRQQMMPIPIARHGRSGRGCGVDLGVSP